MGYGGYGLGWRLLRICFETDASFETREQNREQKSEATKLQGWGNDYLPIHIYICIHMCIAPKKSPGGLLCGWGCRAFTQAVG